VTSPPDASISDRCYVSRPGAHFSSVTHVSGLDNWFCWRSLRARVSAVRATKTDDVLDDLERDNPSEKFSP
jgi:hypothetical protein